MVLLARVELDVAVVEEGLERRLGERHRLGGRHLVGNVGQRHSANARNTALERHLHGVGADADGLEDLRGVVRGQQRDADLGHDLEQAGVDGLAVVVERHVHTDGRNLAVVHQRLGLGRRVPGPHAVVRRVGEHRARAEPDQARDVVGAPGLRRLRHDRGLQPAVSLEQVLVHCANRQERRDVRLALLDAPGLEVGQHQDLGAVLDRLLRGGGELLDRGLESLGTRRNVVERRQRHRLARRLDHVELRLVDDGRVDLDLRGVVGGGLAEDGPLLAEVHVQRHHQVLAQRVDRRVRHLSCVFECASQPASQPASQRER